MIREYRRDDWHVAGLHIIRRQGHIDHQFGVLAWRTMRNRWTLDVWFGPVLWTVRRTDRWGI